MSGDGFVDKTVVITGAAGGIGAALAHRFAEAGARVALLDRDVDGATAVAAELGDAEVLVRQCDVTSLSDCLAAIAAVTSAWGGVDVLVNNAGVTQLGSFIDTNVDVIRRVVDVNLFGAVNCTKAALPSLCERRGRIIVTSSVAGVAPLVGRTGYAASKHALHGFFDSLRAEHRDDGLRVLLVCPSFVDTAIGDHAIGPDGGAAPSESRTGVKAPMAPAHVAAEIVRAAARDRRLLLVGREARLSYWIGRITPRLYERLMVRRTTQA
jgi:NAD(P)-dependent dehydrogenase (short-subunit alcohol dehydrogenase family)